MGGTTSLCLPARAEGYAACSAGLISHAFPLTKWYSRTDTLRLREFDIRFGGYVMTHTETETPATGTTAESPVDPAALHLRLLLLQVQVNAAGSHVNLLAQMGLNGTQGFRDAMTTYETRLADYTALKARFGL